MPYLDLCPHAIPPELQRLPAVLWRAEPNPEKPEKPTKVPYRISDPTRKASSTTPATWGTFWDAIDAYALLTGRHRDPDPALGPLAGIGVVLTADARIVCLDLDRVLEADRLDPRAARVVAKCASWTEVSPSGNGLHIFVRGTLPEALKGDQFEAYHQDRFIALTGHHWAGTPTDVVDRQALLDHFVTLARAQHAPRSPYTGPVTPPPDDLAGALLAKLQAWGVPVTRLKRWSDGFLVELVACPWADEHTTGPSGAAVMIHASGAYDFACPHAHCGGRDWRDFRTAMESR
jgi:hypothetical protein